MKGPLIGMLLLAAIASLHAQDNTQLDTLIIESQDTVLIKSYAARYNPRKALLYSAVLPGLGQVYTKKYWKIPLVYGGIIALGSGIDHYNELHREYKRELFRNLELGYVNDNDRRPGDRVTTRSYRNAVQRARRDRDFLIIMMGVMYLLQIVDAHVDAHLKEFDLNPNLQVRIEPNFEQNALAGRQTGLSLVARF